MLNVLLDPKSYVYYYSGVLGGRSYSEYHPGISDEMLVIMEKRDYHGEKLNLRPIGKKKTLRISGKTKETADQRHSH